MEAFGDGPFVFSWQVFVCLIGTYVVIFAINRMDMHNTLRVY